MIRFKSFTQTPLAFLFLTLFLAATFGVACSGLKGSSGKSGGSSLLGAKTFEGEIKAKMFAGPEPTDVLYAIKGTHTRVEMQFSMPQLSPGGGMKTITQTNITLTDSSSTKQTTLWPESKTYTTMDLNELAGGAARDSSIAFPKVTSTGKTEQIAGLTCQHWRIGDTTDVCLAQGLGYFGGGSGGILDKLKNLAGGKSKAQIDNSEFAEFAEGGAFPLKMARIENGESKTIMEVTVVERKSLNDSLFTIPQDYTKKDIPGMPGAMR